MKMTQAHFTVLKAKVAELQPQIPAHLARLQADPKVKDLGMRLLWDVFAATRILDQYSYQEFDYLDTHIETAMRRAFKELGVPQPSA